MKFRLSVLSLATKTSAQEAGSEHPLHCLWVRFSLCHASSEGQIEDSKQVSCGRTFNSGEIGNIQQLSSYLAGLG